MTCVSQLTRQAVFVCDDINGVGSQRDCLDQSLGFCPSCGGACVADKACSASISTTKQCAPPLCLLRVTIQVPRQKPLRANLVRERTT
jgi:hypothetical protein